MFVARKPDPVVARAELRRNLITFASTILVVRAVPYVLQALQVCGIFGYYTYHTPRSRQAILECLLQGLRRQEYRGYDSAGLALDAVPCGPWAEELAFSLEEAEASPRATGALPPPCMVLKSSGKIADLEAQCYAELQKAGRDLSDEFSTHVGIAHTRWATHGPPSALNAHPHVSGPDHAFVVVHNGIITNFKALRAYLVGKGERFETETDTEVIPKLLAHLHRTLPGPPSFAQLVSRAMRELEGAFGLLVKSAHHPESLVACRRGSPLILGVRVGRREGARREGGVSLGANRVAKAGSVKAAVDGCLLASSPPPPVASLPVASPPPPVADVGASPIVSRRASRSGFQAPPLECFLASDPAAVVEHTRRVVVLEDEDIVHLSRGGYEIFNAAHPEGEEAEESEPAALQAVERALQTLELEVSQIQKGGYDHFMKKEIHEQPETVMQTMRGRVRFHRDASLPLEQRWRERRVTLGDLARHLPAMRASRRLVFVACGTSYNACLAARPTLEALTGLPCALELASDLLDRRAPLFRDDSVFFVSQSGETADTLQALEYARRAGALCLGITNTVGSSIARASADGIHLNAGAEIGVASTKAYSSQVVAILLVACAMAQDSLPARDRVEEIVEAMGTLPDKLREVLLLDARMAALAAELRDETSLLVFGRGVNYAVALEAALKVKEVALMHSEGILAGEMKHGPLALIDASMPVLVLATRDAQHAKMLSVIEQLLARGARLFVLGHSGDEVLEELCQGRARLLQVPWVPDALQPVVNVVPLHLLAYHLTLLRGHDVDQPRNLAKSVTVTEETNAISRKRR